MRVFRSLKNSLQSPEAFLAKNFGEVVQPEEGSNLYRVKGLYALEGYQPNVRNFLSRFHEGRPRGVLTPIQLRAASLDDARGALADYALSRSSDREFLVRYLPKANQSPDVVQTDTPYDYVVNEDPEHAHGDQKGSEKLIDLGSVFMCGHCSDVHKTDLTDDEHFHLLIK